MELLMTLLVGILSGAFNFGFFFLGYKVCFDKMTLDAKEKELKDNVVVDETNKESVKNLMQWMNYRG